MENITTTDLSNFGYREREMAEDLLRASRQQGFPDDFDDDGTTIMFNTHSGDVFFTNSNFEVAMMNDNELESFYSCPMCGHEGFAEDMEHGEDNNDCQEYLRDIGIIDKD